MPDMDCDCGFENEKFRSSCESAIEGAVGQTNRVENSAAQL